MEENQLRYNSFVQNTSIQLQEILCGPSPSVSRGNEFYFIEKYAKSKILDIGCGTGHRTFPEWIKRGFDFQGIEKFQNLIDSSKYKNHILSGDIADESFRDTLDEIQKKNNNSIEIAFLFGGVINGVFGESIFKLWNNLEYLSNFSNYILIDNLSHFIFYDKNDRGQVIQLFDKAPPQYFYSKKEIIGFIEEKRMEIIDEKKEIIGKDENSVEIVRNHFLLKKKNIK